MPALKESGVKRVRKMIQAQSCAYCGGPDPELSLMVQPESITQAAVLRHYHLGCFNYLRERQNLMAREVSIDVGKRLDMEAARMDAIAELTYALDCMVNGEEVENLGQVSAFLRTYNTKARGWQKELAKESA